MLFITGDTHRDFRRFKTKVFYEQRSMTKQDYVVACGDFGIWDDSMYEHHQMDWLNDRPFTTLLVTSNHSNYDRLKKIPVHDWNGGKVQFIRDSVIHLMRGQVFEFAGNGSSPWAERPRTTSMTVYQIRMTRSFRKNGSS